jgi:O-antigen/teichoic acid export membrane protein
VCSSDLPIDVIGRLWIIPGSLVMTLFPAYSTLGTINKEQLQVIHLRATKYITVVMGIIALIIILFSNEILRLWLGVDFAKYSTLPLQIVSLGMLFGSISQLCFAYFQGAGRPDIGAKIHVILLPVSLILTLFLISKIGIVGAALSWTFSRALGMLLSFGVVWNMLELDFTILSRNGLLRQSAWLIVLAVLLLPLLWVNNILYKVCITIFVCSIFFITQIYYIMDTEDKNMVMTVINQLLQSIGIRPTNTVVENRKR